MWDPRQPADSELTAAVRSVSHMTTTLPSTTAIPSSTTIPANTRTVDDVAARVFGASIAAFESMSIYVGERLGWYRSLATDGPATAADLATRTATHPRYAREWLEFQAVYGLLDVHSASPDDDLRRYSISPEVAEVMLGERSLAYLGPLPRMIFAAAGQLPALLDAYRTGGGVSWDDLGPDARESQAVLNRPWLEVELAKAFAEVPTLHAVLSSPGVRVADIGFGGGWSTIGLARAYPTARFQGFDIDGPSVDMARQNAVAAGVADRVSFHLAEGAAMAEHGPFDLVLAFECVHDMARPVEVLRSARETLRPGGAMIVMDEAVADHFTPNGDDLEKFMYGCSMFVCLPDGMSSEPSEGTGTVMRHTVLQGYAERAGFSSVGVLPIENFNLWRFYQLNR